MGKEYDLNNPQTEMEHFILIEGFGGAIYDTNRWVNRDIMDESSGQSAVTEYQQKQKQIVEAIVEKFGIILPPAGPNPVNYADYAPAPEGKQWYWSWYNKMKQEFLESEYNKIICSGCVFSTGDLSRFNSEIPCSVFKGSLLNLFSPYHCGKVPLGGKLPDPAWDEWSRETLIDEIYKKGDQLALDTFLNKEKELKEVERLEYLAKQTK